MRKNHYRHKSSNLLERPKKVIDEYLEILWYIYEKNGKIKIDQIQEFDPNWEPLVIKSLEQQNLITQSNNELKFSDLGFQRARQIVRSHRLAERLLTDVLKLPVDNAEIGACEFEHNVVPEIVDGICTLLGHPRVCPHGFPIPEGDCCKEARKSVQTPTKQLSELKPGQKATIVYINTQSNERMHQFTHLGIRPGAEISVHQTNPVIVIKINSSQIALDENMARDIQVWVEK